MATGVSKENWVERIRDPRIECMSRDEMAALQSERLIDVVNRVYNNVELYRKKMRELGIEPGDIKGIEDIDKLPFTTKKIYVIIIRLGCLLSQNRMWSAYRERPEQQVN